MPKLDPVVKAARGLEARVKAYLHAADKARNPAADPHSKRSKNARTAIGVAIGTLDEAVIGTRLGTALDA